jgi:hypothetical protein
VWKKCHYQNLDSVLKLNCHFEWWQLQIFIVYESAMNRWRGVSLSMKICPFITVFCFFRAVFHSSCDFLHPHYIGSTKYNSDFTDMIWSIWKMCGLLYLIVWLMCLHAVLSFTKDHASFCSCNVDRHLESINSGLWMECLLMVKEKRVSEQWLVTS